MANVLYRFGEWIFANKFKALFGGLGALLLVAMLALGIGFSFSDEITIPGTPSEEAMKVLNESFPPAEDAGNGSVRIVMKAPEGETLVSDSIRAKAEQALEALLDEADVSAVSGPYDPYSLSESQQIGYATVKYKLPAGEVGNASMDALERTVQTLRASGIQAEYDGNIGSVIPEIGGLSEVIGIIVAFLILAYTFRSMLVAGLPILTAVLGLGIGILLVLLGTNVMEITSISITLAVMLGLAVGIDYALFIISRYRQSMAEGCSVRQSLAIANATAGSAVVFAGMTVIIALLALAVVGIPFLATMGIAAAVTVAVAIAVAVTVVPALLALAGERLRPKPRSQSAAASAAEGRWGRIIGRFPLPVAIAAILLLLFISLPALRMETGLPDNGMKSDELTERRAYDLLAEGFGPGFNGPLILIAQAGSGDTASEKIGQALERIRTMENVAFLSEPLFDGSGSTALIQLVPGSGPNDSSTKALVQQIRQQDDQLEQQEDVQLMVTGGTAVNIDISDKLNEALPKFAVLIVVLAVLLLMVVFRSIWIPVKAVFGYLLTLAATLGFIVYVVQEGHLASWFGIPEPGPVLSFLPVLTAGILFGLAMDYEVFLVSRMREAYIRTGDGSRAVLDGLRASGGVVTAAGLIMVVVFASFVFVEEPMIKAMGLALAFGIFVDAFIVRLTIVPALMVLMPKASWYYPKWLSRITPHVDIEGESIQAKGASPTVDPSPVKA